MDKLRMQTANKADENFRKLAAMFPNAVTEAITGYDANGKAIVDRAIDKDVLMQEISCTVVDGNEERYQLLGRTRRSPFFLPMPRSIRRCVPAVRKVWTLILPKTSILRAIIWKC